MSTIKEKSLKYNLHSWSAQGSLNPKVITKAEGIYFWDEDGNKYYDMSAQLVNSNLGHGNKALIQAIKDQADKMPFMGPGFAVDVRSDAAEAIVKLSGLKNAKVFFTNAGAEANENAIKIAKQYTGRWKIFSMYRCYHGSSAGAGMLTGEPRHFANEPGPAGYIKYDGPYAYRAPKQVNFKDEDDVADFYLELLENQVLYEGPQSIAAIFLETVVGSNGVLVPPTKWVKGVRDICTKYGILMVCDEVMAGWYRTGKAFAYQNFGIEPDLVSFAKGSTCGYVPLGGVIVSEKIQKYFDDHKMMCGLTYNAHPMGCAVTVAAVEEYKRLNIEDHVNKVGKVLGEILEDLSKKHKSVGQVRYIGLFSAMELIKDEDGTPIVSFNNDPDGLMNKIVGMLVKEGFWTYSHENMLIVAPPLTITEEELREAMAIMDKVLDSVDKMI
ncbi:MAG TPA: aminotransferase class III-fold pyridoxal phosphate-dependent enzyme [Candidatus Copromorpha excrementigallinarum]|uniref:Aminotransferase class III-fold pyridoxal phosphate-dependent enzyme n=1 Tax=Candidatus Allocopromorpha excrementigallinarum TaxID=2840742 RepID=A0A9D1I215_9FIRM|nr:aminotransferase class III-fold pyridoxal phosphate-dependent enzyme [Candidatus Copromorpha excrementigallinarum]